MVFLALAFASLVWYFLTILFNKREYLKRDYDTAQSASIIFIFVWLFFGMTSIFISRYNHYDDFAIYNLTSADLEIYEERRSDLTKKFGDILSTQYVDHENQIFDKMSDQDVEMLFTKYPELKANTTLMELADKVFKISDDCYRKRIQMNEIIKDIQMRYHNPLVFSPLLPNIPDNINLEN